MRSGSPNVQHRGRHRGLDLKLSRRQRPNKITGNNSSGEVVGENGLRAASKRRVWSYFPRIRTFGPPSWAFLSSSILENGVHQGRSVVAQRQIWPTTAGSQGAWRNAGTKPRTKRPAVAAGSSRRSSRIPRALRAFSSGSSGAEGRSRTERGNARGAQHSSFPCPDCPSAGKDSSSPSDVWTANTIDSPPRSAANPSCVSTAREPLPATMSATSARRVGASAASSADTAPRRSCRTSRRLEG